MPALDSTSVELKWRILTLWSGGLCGPSKLCRIFCAFILHLIKENPVKGGLHHQSIIAFFLLCSDPEFLALQTSDTTFVLTCSFFRLTWRDTLMCVLSACLLLTFCAAFAWERPNSNLQKHTVVNCQGWSLSCYPPLYIKKLRFSLWCAGTLVLLGTMPPAFLLHSSPVNPADISQESA